MSSEYLVQTTDYTVSGNTVTMLSAPAAGIRHEFHYSYIPAGGDGKHKHYTDVKSDWTGADTSWTLTFTPNLGEARMWRFPSLSLWFTPGATDTLGTQRGELWKMGTDETPALVWTATNDYEYITSLTYCQADDNLYMGTHDQFNADRWRWYRINQSTDTPTLLFTRIGSDADPTSADPPIDAAEFGGKLYILSAGYWGDNVQEIHVFDPSDDSHSLVYALPTYQLAGGIAVDPVNNQLVVNGGYQQFRSADGTTWVADGDLETAEGIADSHSLITNRYDDNYIYMGNAKNGFVDNTKSIFRRTGVGAWEINRQESVHDEELGIVSFGSEYSGTTPTALYAQQWNFSRVNGSNVLRKAAGASVWTVDWTGPPVGFQGSYPQAFQQFNSIVYAIWNDSVLNKTRLYKRIAATNWTLVQEFTDCIAAITEPGGTLAIAASPNVDRFCHEV